MGSVNKVIIVGRLGADPEIRTTNSGDRIANLRVATSETWKDRSGDRQERTEWHRVVVFSEGLVELAEKYLRKGSEVYLEGKVQTRKYTDSAGVEKFSTEVVLPKFGGSMTLLGKPVADADGREDAPPRAERPRESFTADLDDDIPF